MKLYISVDMEGITGIVAPIQADNDKLDYSLGRKLMLGDLIAAIEGARLGGATEILINDSHDYMTNLDVRKLPSGVRLLQGSSKLFSMMEAMNSEFDGAFFIGYHARRGTPMACFAHTYSMNFRNIRLNGKPMGEFGLNASVAGYFGVPALLVSGDQAFAGETKDLVPNVHCAVVKESLGYQSTISLTPADSADLIRENAKQAVRGYRSARPLVPGDDILLELELQNEAYADIGQRVYGVNRIDPFTLQTRGRDYLNVYKTMLAVMSIVGTVQ